MITTVTHWLRRPLPSLVAVLSWIEYDELACWSEGESSAVSQHRPRTTRGWTFLSDSSSTAKDTIFTDNRPTTNETIIPDGAHFNMNEEYSSTRVHTDKVHFPVRLRIDQYTISSNKGLDWKSLISTHTHIQWFLLNSIPDYYSHN